MVLTGGYGIALILEGAGLACLLAGLWARRSEGRASAVGLGAGFGTRPRRPVRLRLAPPPRTRAPVEAGAGQPGQAGPALRRAFPDRSPAPGTAREACPA